MPLTLAIIQALLVKVCEEIYAIPLGSIDSTINITPADIKTVQNKEVILLRGQIIPIVRLADVLNIPKTDEQEPEELFVVIVHIGEHRAGVIVDNLIGQQEIVIKSLGKLLAGIKVIAGATFVGEHSYSTQQNPIAAGRPDARKERSRSAARAARRPRRPLTPFRYRRAHAAS